MSHPGVWGQGYCCLQRCRLSGESRNPRNPNSEGQQVNSGLRATPEVAEAHSRQSIRHIPVQYAFMATRGCTETGADVDSGFAGKTERKFEDRLYSMPLWQLAGVQKRGPTWIPAFAGKTEGQPTLTRMTSFLKGGYDVAHLPERWAIRSSSLIIPAGNSGMTHVVPASGWFRTSLAGGH